MWVREGHDNRTHKGGIDKFDLLKLLVVDGHCAVLVSQNDLFPFLILSFSL